jgi:hypothetical protein
MQLVVNVRRLVMLSVISVMAAGCAAGAPQASPTGLPQVLVAEAPTATTAPLPTATSLPSATPAAAPTATGVPASRSTPTAQSANVSARPTSESRQPGPASETGSLASKFEAAINAGDVDGVLALFEPDAEVKVPPDRYLGLTQIRNWVSYLADQHFAIEPGFRSVVGERASWPAEVRSDYLVRIGLPSLSGTASITVHDGLINTYTYVLTQDSAHRHREAQLAATEVLQDPVIVGQDAANVYGFNDVFHDADGHLVSYRDVLTAEPGSGPFYDLGGELILIRSGI